MLQFFKDHIEIVAIISSPIIAFYVGFFHNRITRKRDDKRYVFLTLFQMRAEQTGSYEWVRAVNYIPIAFYRNKNVLNAYKAYRDALNTVNYLEHQDALMGLLFEMAQELDYSKIRPTDISQYYLPTWLLNEQGRYNSQKGNEPQIQP